MAFMDTTLTIRATRIVSVAVDGGYVVAAFKPGPLTIKELEAAEGTETVINLEDETGLWSNDRTVEIAEVTVSEDRRALTVRLVSVT